MTTPFVITVVRTRRRRRAKASTSGFRRPQRQHPRDESIRWFVVALLCLGLLAAISASPLFQTLKALVSPWSHSLGILVQAESQNCRIKDFDPSDRRVAR